MCFVQFEVRQVVKLISVHSKTGAAETGALPVLILNGLCVRHWSGWQVAGGKKEVAGGRRQVGGG